MDLWVELATAILTLAAVVLTLSVKRAVNEVHIKVNSRLDTLLASQRAEGVTEGRAQEKAEQESRP